MNYGQAGSQVAEKGCGMNLEESIAREVKVQKVETNLLRAIEEFAGTNGEYALRELKAHTLYAEVSLSCKRRGKDIKEMMEEHRDIEAEAESKKPNKKMVKHVIGAGDMMERLLERGYEPDANGDFILNPEGSMQSVWTTAIWEECGKVADYDAIVWEEWMVEDKLVEVVE